MEDSMNNRNKGLVLALVTMVVSGVSVFVNKFAVGAITPPLVFTAVKNTGVGLLVLSLLLVTRKMKQIRKLKKSEVIKLIAIGVVGGSLPFYLFFTGLSQIPAVNAALIHKSLVLWVALLAIPLLKEKLSMLQIGVIGLLFSSNLVVGGFGGFSFSTGELMVLGATLFWAVENVIAKKVLENVDADIVTGARMGLGSLILLGASVVAHPASLAGIFTMSGNQWMWMIVTAAALMAYVSSWYRALKFAPATLVATVLVGSTVITNLLSAVFVTHALPQQILVQAGLVVVGLGVFISESITKKIKVGIELV
jgi:drug/metabolite transporter (DMT)-like permease